MKLLLTVLLPILFESSRAQTFTRHECAQIDEDNSLPVQQCTPTSYSQGAYMDASKQENETICASAVADIPGFTHQFGRDFGRFRFKIISTEENPVEAYNCLRCQGSPRRYFVKKTGPNKYDVYYQPVATPLPFDPDSNE